MGDWLNQLKTMMQGQPSGPPQRLGFAERLIAAGRPLSQNVEMAPQGPDYYDNPPDPRTAWTPLGQEVDDWRKEQEIGYPFPSDPGFETQTRAMPDISQGMYSPAAQTDMGPYEPIGGVRSPDDMGMGPLPPGSASVRMPSTVPFPPRRPR